MKVLVIGGTGAFGARLCDLLARDGVDVTVAGRQKKVRTKRSIGGLGFVHNRENATHPAEFPYLTLDRDGPLDGFENFDVVVDAAGPFHAYGDDPYRVARAAIAAGAHYFDLCDNADFCEGIRVLDVEAKAGGVCVASGMSSVPAISSSVVTALCGGATPQMIESAILPGNKAPRGRAVVESILDQTGRLYTEKQAGRDVSVRSWSGPKTYDLGSFRRQGWRIEVPDQRLFPDHFDCPTVIFRASLELGVMRYGLGALSFMRSKLGFGIPDWLIRAAMRGADALASFGTDTGGMVVEVTLPQSDEFIRKSWTMRANSGDGPNTPAIAVRAACRDLGALSAGAFPALSLISLEQIERCFEDLDIETDTKTEGLTPIFREVLGPDFDTLPDAIKVTHDAVAPRFFKGVASVTRGTGLQARIAALLVGFPPTTGEVDVEVTKIPDGSGEAWLRRFDARTFRSYLRPRQGLMTERFGPFTFELDLHVRDGKLHFPVKAGWLFGLPVPRALLPQSIASEAEIDGIFHFDVLLKAPTGATLVHYKGWLEAV